MVFLMLWDTVPLRHPCCRHTACRFHPASQISISFIFWHTLDCQFLARSLIYVSFSSASKWDPGIRERAVGTRERIV